LDPNSARPEVPPDTQHECDELPSHADEIGDAFLELPVYKEIITGHSAYDWLLQSIKKELYLGNSHEGLVNIRETIFKASTLGQYG
jgi:hypothetical protein